MRVEMLKGNDETVRGIRKLEDAVRIVDRTVGVVVKDCGLTDVWVDSAALLLNALAYVKGNTCVSADKRRFVVSLMGMTRRCSFGDWLRLHHEVCEKAELYCEDRTLACLVVSFLYVVNRKIAVLSERDTSCVS